MARPRRSISARSRISFFDEPPGSAVIPACLALRWNRLAGVTSRQGLTALPGLLRGKRNRLDDLNRVSLEGARLKFPLASCSHPSVTEFSLACEQSWKANFAVTPHDYFDHHCAFFGVLQRIGRSLLCR